MPTRRVDLTLNEGELILLYALAGREWAECALEGIGAGIAGPHAEHRPAAGSALAKLSDAVLALQETNTTKEQ
jgi:hypothetical protein